MGGGHPVKVLERQDTRADPAAVEGNRDHGLVHRGGDEREVRYFDFGGHHEIA